MTRYDKQEAKVIYKVYKDFYKKEPIFSEDNFRNITIEIQSMAYILDEYGVMIGPGRFSKKEYRDLNLPMDLDIQDIIIRQIEKNEDLNDSSLIFSKRAIKIIDIVGKVIRSVMNNTQTPIETLRTISCILCIKKSHPFASEELIKALADCKDEDLDNFEKVIDAIKNEACKDNFDKNNIENLDKMIKESAIDAYRMLVSESGTGKNPTITDESRKSTVKTLLR